MSLCKRKGHRVTWGDTPKATLIRIGEEEHWLPKRFVTFVADPGDHTVGDTPGAVLMPKWLAKKLKI